MKIEETIAQEYLLRISHDVVYEPDGKIPPDFKLNQAVGVEVRRLNQNISTGKKLRGLEQERISLFLALNKVFREFDAEATSDNFWVSLDFRRPIGRLSGLGRMARTALEDFVKNKSHTPYRVELSPNVSMTIIKAQRKTKRLFEIGIELDEDSGGWTGLLYRDNISLCIDEKTTKIQAYKSRYLEWWLVLIDFMLGGIEEPEKAQVIEQLGNPSDWNMIVVIHPETKGEILKIGSSSILAV